MFSKKYNHLLARVNFPLYTIHCVTERHILVAGGGGSSKTGIPNVIEIYELVNDGPECRAEPVTRYETDDAAIMNCVIYPGKFLILFAGMDGNCQLYKIRYEVYSDRDSQSSSSESSNSPSLGLNKRGSEKCTTSKQKLETSNSNADGLASKVSFSIHPLFCFQTDFSEDPFQKLVKFSTVSKMLATAGTDGYIRMWKYPNMNKLYEIHAHDDDVDDIDFCPSGERIVSVSRDGHGKVWNVIDGTKITDLEHSLLNKSEGAYVFRNCRFGLLREDNNLLLFTTLNPAVRQKPPLPSFICKWNTKHFSVEKTISTGTDMLSVMTISDNCHFVGLGTQGGSVKIYIAFNLELVYNLEHAHGIFVTGLEFLPTSEESKRITGGYEATLVSISVDNHINIHYIPERATIRISRFIILFILVLLFVFVMMDFFNL